MSVSALQFSTGAGLGKPNLLGFCQNCKNQESLNLNPLKVRSHRKFNLILAHCCKNSHGNFGASLDGNWFLKTKGKEVASCLNGRCIFLVGMMGSGKTTVGKVLSDALGYTFVDSDKYVEQTTGRTFVADIFKECREAYFRENESEALHKLSLMPQHVVATGGGAVVHPINWRYMRQGITVFLDVPVDALARRIAAVGTDSRPLLDFDSDDTYTKALMGLFTLSKKRSEAYENADATVSLPNLAASLGLEDVLDIKPTSITLEVLVQIDKHLNR